LNTNLAILFLRQIARPVNTSAGDIQPRSTVNTEMKTHDALPKIRQTWLAFSRRAAVGTVKQPKGIACQARQGKLVVAVKEC